jgi:hypothetical protein
VHPANHPRVPVLDEHLWPLSNLPQARMSCIPARWMYLAASGYASPRKSEPGQAQSTAPGGRVRLRRRATGNLSLVSLRLRADRPP